ncbi:MAG: hypothetical protein RBR48_04525 [Bacilli bacterium]|jgi:hypothetical protein|nr:hypothetical protein [Bacilli bacterium]MDD4056228.1 hypothetical protein [Bacilli bacterium]MDY0209426.1 hypothetical protein [Bacilli bacterium]
MNNYEKFINDFKVEADSKKMVNQSEIIKAQYKINHASSLKQSKMTFKWGFSLLTVLVLAFVGYLIWDNDKIKPVIDIPGIETIDETYAFEIAAAANMIYNMDLSEMTLSTFTDASTLLDLARRNAEETPLDSVAIELNKYIYTIKQLLDNEVVDAKETTILEGDYQYQMVIRAPLNEGVLVEYKMYYNKIDITNSIYRLDGIIEIDGQFYSIKGAQEDLENEQTLMIRIYFSDENFVSIHQIIEEGMIKFIYREFINNHRASELAIGIGERRGYRIISIDSREGKVRGSFDALYLDSKLIIRSRYDKYRGNIRVEIIGLSEVRYYFVNEDKEIIINKSGNLEMDYRFLFAVLIH